MNHFRWIIAAVFAVSLMLVICPPAGVVTAARPAATHIASCEAGPSGLLVYQPAPAQDNPNPTGLVVADPATRRLVRTIDLPKVTALAPAGLPGFAFALTDSGTYVVDAARGVASKILAPANSTGSDLFLNPLEFRGTAGHEYQLLGDGPMSEAVLVGLTTHTAVDLAALISKQNAPAPFIGQAAVASDDQHVFVWDGKSLFLVATAKPDHAELIDPNAFGPAFSPDGRDLIYSRITGKSGGSEIVERTLSSGKTRAVVTSDQAAISLWAPGQNRILIDDRSIGAAAAGKLSVLDLSTGARTALLSYAGSTLSVQFTPDGEKALVAINPPDQSQKVAWYLFDLATGASQQIAGGMGLTELPGLYADSNWAIFAPSPGLPPSADAASLGVLNLKTGVYRTVSTGATGQTYLAPELSRDGRFALLAAVGSAQMTLWLIDEETGAVRMLTQAYAIKAAFSPDGCWVAISTSEPSPTLPKLTVTIAQTAGNASETIGDGRSAIWIAAP